MQCSNWATSKGPKTVSVGSCNGAFAMSDERRCYDQGYDDKVCMFGNNTYNDGIHGGGYVEFQSLSDDECSNEKPVYYHMNGNNTYFLHYAMEIGKWTVSKDKMSTIGEIFCDKSNLFECSVNEWDVENVTITEYEEVVQQNYTISAIDYNVEYFADPQMFMINGQCQEEEAVNNAFGATEYIAIIMIILCVIVLIAGCIWWRFRKNKKEKHIQKEAVGDESDEEEQEIEVNTTL